jgi:hypothetical protein
MMMRIHTLRSLLEGITIDGADEAGVCKLILSFFRLLSEVSESIDNNGEDQVQYNWSNIEEKDDLECQPRSSWCGSGIVVRWQELNQTSGDWGTVVQVGEHTLPNRIAVYTSKSIVVGKHVLVLEESVWERV